MGKTHGRGAQRVDALVDIDLDVAPGEFVAITGRSGSGKTTLLNVAGALDEPTTGNVWVEGNDLGDLSNNDLARIRRVSVGMCSSRSTFSRYSPPPRTLRSRSNSTASSSPWRSAW